MSPLFQELASHPTPMGEITLRRRREPSLQVDVYEVKLGDEFLMSSLFTASEAELAKLALAELPGDDLDIVVGGLGLGYTARAALADPRVRSLHVIEAFQAVIDWHQQDLVPNASALTSEPRCHLVHGDFFALVASGSSFGEQAPPRCDAVLLDVDHTPRHHLAPSHAEFYRPEGLQKLVNRLRPGGVFALWSDDLPDAGHMASAEQVFAAYEPRVVEFPNPHTGGKSSSTVYIGRP